MFLVLEYYIVLQYNVLYLSKAKRPKMRRTVCSGLLWRLVVQPCLGYGPDRDYSPRLQGSCIQFPLFFPYIRLDCIKTGSQEAAPGELPKYRNLSKYCVRDAKDTKIERDRGRERKKEMHSKRDRGRERRTESHSK